MNRVLVWFFLYLLVALPSLTLGKLSKKAEIRQKRYYGEDNSFKGNGTSYENSNPNMTVQLVFVSERNSSEPDSDETYKNGATFIKCGNIFVVGISLLLLL